MKKILLRIFFNTLIGVALVALWLHFVNFSDIVEKISHANPLTIVWVGLCLAASSFLRASRLWLILDQKSLPLTQIAFITYISQFLSFIIPIRAGEIAKSVYLVGQTKIAFTKALAVIFIDRLIDFWIVITLLCLLLLTIPSGVPTYVTEIIALLVILISAGLVTTIYYPKVMKKIVTTVLVVVFIPKIKTVLTSFSNFLIDAFSILKVDHRRQLLIVIVSICSWLFESLAWYFVLTSLGLENVWFLTIVLGTMLMSLSFLLPAAPGYLGSLQAAGLLIFGYWLGFDNSIVSAATVFMHLAIVIYILISGITSLYLLKFDLTQVWKKVKQN